MFKKEETGEQKKARADKCSKELAKLLDKHKCQLIVGMFVTAQGNTPQVNIATRD